MGAAGAVFGGGAGLTLLGAGMEASGQLIEGKALREAGQYRAQILKRNAQFSKALATDAIRRGEVEAQRQQTKAAQFIGSQRAALAAAGVLVDEGSAVDLQADTAYVGAQEVQDIRLNAEREALQYKMNAFNQEADATLAAFTGQQQYRASKYAAKGTLLTGLGNVALSGAGAFA